MSVQLHRSSGKTRVCNGERYIPRVTCSRASSELAPWFTGKGIRPSRTKKPGGSAFLTHFQNTVGAQPRRLFRFFQRLLSSPRGKPDLKATGYNEFEHSWAVTDNSSLQLGSHTSDPVTLTGNHTSLFWIKERQAVSTGKNALVTADFPVSFALGSLSLRGDSYEPFPVK